MLFERDRQHFTQIALIAARGYDPVNYDLFIKNDHVIAEVFRFTKTAD